MTTINELAQSVSEMSDDELLERMRQLRGARRVPTAIPRNGIKTKSAKAKAISGSKLLSSLSTEQAAELLAMLEGN